MIPFVYTDPPTHPPDELLKSKTKQQVRNIMNTYGKRIARAVVPEDKQKKAERRNFVTRTAQKMTPVIDNREVLTDLVIKFPNMFIFVTTLLSPSWAHKPQWATCGLHTFARCRGGFISTNNIKQEFGSGCWEKSMLSMKKQANRHRSKSTS